MVRTDGSGHSMIVAQEFVQNQGDAWQYTQNYLARFIETMGLGNKDISDEADQLSGYASFSRSVGTRLAELHAVLAAPSDHPAFAPEPTNRTVATAWAEIACPRLISANASNPSETSATATLVPTSVRCRRVAAWRLASTYSRCSGVGAGLR